MWLWCAFGSYGQFGGLFHFSCSVVDFIFVFSPSSLGDVKELLGTFPRCDHTDRVLLGVRGYRSKVTGTCPAPVSAYIRIHTAGDKLGLNVTSVLGSSLQLSYIKKLLLETTCRQCISYSWKQLADSVQVALRNHFPTVYKLLLETTCQQCISYSCKQLADSV